MNSRAIEISKMQLIVFHHWGLTTLPIKMTAQDASERHCRVPLVDSTTNIYKYMPNGCALSTGFGSIQLPNEFKTKATTPSAWNGKLSIGY